MARQGPASPPGLILDAGAVQALALKEPEARAALTAAVEVGAFVVVPAIVVAKVTRGGPGDAAVNRVLDAVGQIVGHGEAVARLAGRLLSVSRSQDTVAALVVAEANAGGGGVVLTTDPETLRPLVDATSGRAWRRNGSSGVLSFSFSWTGSERSLE